MSYIDKWKNWDRCSTLSSFDGLLLIMYAGIVNIRFLTQSAVDPKYCLLDVNLFTPKIYAYRIKGWSLLKIKLEQFYRDLELRKKNWTIQTDQEVKKVKKKYNVYLFNSSTKGGKVFKATTKTSRI